MLCLLERGPDHSLESRALPSTPLLLAPYMLGLEGDTERERRRFELYADLVSAATLVRLDLLEAPIDRLTLADLIEQALVEPVRCSPRDAAR